MKCLAPMVDGSELAFRLLLNNVTHTWTPMYNCNMLLNNPKFARTIVDSIKLEQELTGHKVVLQFATNSTEALEQAYALLADNTADFVEINFGCAQAIAQKGGYGSYLLDNLPLCFALIEKLKQISNKPLALKTRLFDRLDYFFDGAARLGVTLFTLHGRMKGLKMGCYSGPSDFNAILKHMNTLKENHKVTFILNGGIWNYQQHEKFVNLGADGTMSANFILQNPFIYTPKSNPGVGSTEYQQLRTHTYQQIEHMKNEVKKTAIYSQTQDLFKRYRNDSELVKMIYIINPAFKNYPTFDSLSVDVQNVIIKNNKPGVGTGYLFVEKELKMQILVTALQMIENHVYCTKMNVENPWSALVSHVICLCGRDTMNYNVDVRKVLTDAKSAQNQDDYPAFRMGQFKTCIVELLDRLENELGFVETESE
ncbi:TRNA_dihydrouridine synthase [Hexamita inflata]|uniref:tRNA_dihydrouridine synthase n=1 Tax=Hexamita inflata TaxID=28002 RepID=A0ABP1HHN5_9EUKA